MRPGPARGATRARTTCSWTRSQETTAALSPRGRPTATTPACECGRRERGEGGAGGRAGGAGGGRARPDTRVPPRAVRAWAGPRTSGGRARRGFVAGERTRICWPRTACPRGTDPQRLSVRSDPLSLRHGHWHGLGRETRGLGERVPPGSGSPALPGARRGACPCPRGARSGPPAARPRTSWRVTVEGRPGPAHPAPGHRVRSGTGKCGRLSHPESQARSPGAPRGCGRLASCGGEGVEVVCGELVANTGFYLRTWRFFGFSFGGGGGIGGWQGRAEGGMREKPSLPPRSGERTGSWQIAFLPLCHVPRLGSVGP